MSIEKIKKSNQKIVLFPTEIWSKESASTYNVYQAVINLCIRLGAKLKIVTVVKPPCVEYQAPNIFITPDKSTDSQNFYEIEELISIEQVFQEKGIKCTSRVLNDNDISKAIINEAICLQADYIVMGVKSMEVPPIFTSRVAREVLKSSPVPVILIRHGISVPDKLSYSNHQLETPAYK